MAEAKMVETRVAALRALMERRGYDAVILRNNPDLFWLTGASGVFDSEVAHVACVTSDGLWLHTDSRYYNSFIERLGADGPWKIDQEVKTAPVWAAERIAEVQARVVAIEDTSTLAFFDELSYECGKASIAPLMPRMHGDICNLRMVKDEGELAVLRQAQVITDEAFEFICGFVKVGMSEQQIRAALDNFMLSHGANGLSFDSIIASGPNGANPHARPGARQVQLGDLIVMDYGALYQGYHADMTRTVCIGEPSAEQRAVYDVVRRAHETCAAAVHAGVNGREIHEMSVRIITDAGYGAYYGHGLGHGVGIEIHERPCLNPYWDKPIPAGAVVTVEPGIYLPGKFGIRLEDCGVVTEEGFEPFTGPSHDLYVIAG